MVFYDYFVAESVIDCSQEFDLSSISKISSELKIDFLPYLRQFSMLDYPLILALSTIIIEVK